MRVVARRASEEKEEEVRTPFFCNKFCFTSHARATHTHTHTQWVISLATLSLSLSRVPDVVNHVVIHNHQRNAIGGGQGKGGNGGLRQDGRATARIKGRVPKTRRQFATIPSSNGRPAHFFPAARAANHLAQLPQNSIVVCPLNTCTGKEEEKEEREEERRRREERAAR